jgi:hypothetical protein
MSEERAEQHFKDEKNRSETKFNEKWKQDRESLVYDREEMKMSCTDCADFNGEIIKTEKCLRKLIQTQVFLWF